MKLLVLFRKIFPKKHYKIVGDGKLIVTDIDAMLRMENAQRSIKAIRNLRMSK